MEMSNLQEALSRLALRMIREARDMQTEERNKRDAGETVDEWARGYRGGYVQAVREVCDMAGIQFKA